MNRAEILKQAEICVTGERADDYGAPENNFHTIAKLWNAYLGDVIVDPVDVSMMLALLKIARIRSGQHKSDSYVDLAGYAACAGELAAINLRRKKIHE